MNLPHPQPVINDQIIRETKKIIAQAFHIPHELTHNPAPNPVSMEKHHMTFLKNHLDDYVASPKADGTRYLLVLGTVMTNNEPEGFAVMVDRKMVMYDVTLYASADYFRGSVFDGELVTETKIQRTDHDNFSSNPVLKRQKYLVFDAYQIKGLSVQNKTLMERYKYVTHSFDLESRDILDGPIQQWIRFAKQMAEDGDKIVSGGNHFSLMFQVKPMIQVRYLNSLWRSMNQLEYSTDGIIFTPIPESVQINTHSTCWKWKPHHTLDFIIEGNQTGSSWSYRMWYQEDNRLVDTETNMVEIDSNRKAKLIIEPNDYLKLTAKIASDNHQTKFKYLGECNLNISTNSKSVLFVKCEVVRWRRDKSTPNNKWVVIKTLNSVIEQVSIDDLIQITDDRTRSIDQLIQNQLDPAFMQT